MCRTGNLSSTDALGGIDCSDYLDLRVLVPDYIASIPEEPSTTGDGAGYRVSTDSSLTRVFVKPSIVEALTCPEGFIPVPGNTNIGTEDFCVMKYEAKVDDDSDGQGDTTQVTTGAGTWPNDTHPVGSGG